MSFGPHQPPNTQMRPSTENAERRELRFATAGEGSRDGHASVKAPTAANDHGEEGHGGERFKNGGQVADTN